MANFSNYNQLLEILQAQKAYIDSKAGGGTVKSASLNGGTPVLPDASGNVDLTVPTPDLTDYVQKSFTIFIQTSNGVVQQTLNNLNTSADDVLITKSYLNSVIPAEGSYVKSISVNGGTAVTPNISGLANLSIPTYTLELDGTSVTASLDGGDPVSPENGNIDLTIPRTYAKKIKTVAGEFEVDDNYTYVNDEGQTVEVNNDHIIDLGYTGRPFNMYKLNFSVNNTGKRKYFLIKPLTGGLLHLYNHLGDEITISTIGATNIHGDVFVIRLNYRSLGDYYAISMGAPVIDIKCESYTAAYLITGQNSDGTYVTKVLMSNEAWNTRITPKAFTVDDFNAASFPEGTEFRWVFCPVTQRIESTSNTYNPELEIDILSATASADTQQDSRDVIFKWIPDEAYTKGKWIFSNCYTEGMSYEGEVSDYTFKLPYYPSVKLQGWKLLDFRITSNTVSRNYKDCHCILKDSMGNTIADINLNSCALGNSSWGLDKVYHIYKYLHWDSTTYQWELVDAGVFIN